MKILILISLTLCLSKFSNAQMGCVRFYYPEITTRDFLRVKFFSENDSVSSAVFDIKGEHKSKVCLTPGIYNVQMILNRKVRAEYYDIVVKEDSLTEIDVRLERNQGYSPIVPKSEDGVSYQRSESIKIKQGCVSLYYEAITSSDALRAIFTLNGDSTQNYFFDLNGKYRSELCMNEGVYSMRINLNGDNFIENHYVKIKGDSTREMEIELPRGANYSLTVDTLFESQTFFADHSFKFLYGAPLNKPSGGSPFIGSFDLGYNMNVLKKINRNYAIGFVAGTDLTLTSFKKNHSVSKTAHDNVRYFSWDFAGGIINRISKEKNEYHDLGPVFDFGFAYYFPFTYRYIEADNKKKIQQRGIVKYTNFSIFTRLGYEHFTIQLEYTPINYFKSGYPPIPQLKIGLAVLIPNN